MTDVKKANHARGIIGKITRPFVFIFPACAIVVLILRLMDYEVIDNGAKVGLLIAYCIIGVLFAISYYLNRLSIISLIAVGAVAALAFFAGSEALIISVIAAASVIPAIIRDKRVGIIIVCVVYILMSVFGAIVVLLYFLGESIHLDDRDRYFDSPNKKYTIKTTEEWYGNEYELDSLEIYEVTPFLLAKKLNKEDYSSSGYDIIKLDIQWTDNKTFQAKWRNMNEDKVYSKQFNISSDKFRLDEGE